MSKVKLNFLEDEKTRIQEYETTAIFNQESGQEHE